MSETPTPITVAANTVLKLPKPSYVLIESSDGEHSYRVDSFVVLRMLIGAENSPNEEVRWTKVREWIAERLDIPIENITENMALFLHNQVIDLTNIVKKEVARDVFTTASSAQPTLESQVNS